MHTAGVWTRVTHPEPFLDKDRTARSLVRLWETLVETPGNAIGNRVLSPGEKFAVCRDVVISGFTAKLVLFSIYIYI